MEVTYPKIPRRVTCKIQEVFVQLLGSQGDVFFPFRLYFSMGWQRLQGCMSTVWMVRPAEDIPTACELPAHHPAHSHCAPVSPLRSWAWAQSLTLSFHCMHLGDIPECPVYQAPFNEHTLGYF
jgi:hypothetical protein